MRAIVRKLRHKNKSKSRNFSGHRFGVNIFPHTFEEACETSGRAPDACSSEVTVDGRLIASWDVQNCTTAVDILAAGTKYFAIKLLN